MEQRRKKVLLIGVDQAILCLLKKFMDEEILPNITRLVEDGILGEAYSCPPCDTPTNWTTIATGATTAVHGATSFYLHIPGEPLDLGLKHRSRTQLSRYCQAEYMWDVSDRHGITPFVINYPAGWPSNFKKGAMSLLMWPIPESLPKILSPPSLYTFSSNASNPSLRLSKSKESDENLESPAPILQAFIEIKHSTVENPESLKIYLLDTEGQGYNAILLPLFSEKGIQILKKEEWSDWISVDLSTTYGILPCIFKVRFLELARDGSLLKIQRTTLYNTKGWTNPDSLGKDIITNAMYYDVAPKDQEVEYMIPGKVESYLLYARREAQTLARAISYAKKHIGWDLCFFHTHILDSVNHKELAYLYKDSPFYTEKSAEKATENVRTAYKIVDELVESVMKTCVDEDTITVLLADHGAVPAWKIANLPSALMRSGLLTYKWKNSKKKFMIDWNKTLAFPYLEPPYIWVNLKGRDPNGIVSQSKYESVRDDVIQTLLNMRDPGTGDKIVRLALRREEAAFLGQNGERVGDIIYFLNPPYQIFDGRLEQLNAAERTPSQMAKPEAYNARNCFGAHAYYLPTTNFGNFTVSCPLIMKGPDFKKGIELKNAVNLMDIAPTLSHLLQIPRPKHSQGRIIHEAIE